MVIILIEEGIMNKKDLQNLMLNELSNMPEFKKTMKDLAKS